VGDWRRTSSNRSSIAYPRQGGVVRGGNHRPLVKSEPLCRKKKESAKKGAGRGNPRSWEPIKKGLIEAILRQSRWGRESAPYFEIIQGCGWKDCHTSIIPKRNWKSTIGNGAYNGSVACPPRAWDSACRVTKKNRGESKNRRYRKVMPAGGQGKAIRAKQKMLSRVGKLKGQTAGITTISWSRMKENLSSSREGKGDQRVRKKGLLRGRPVEKPTRTCAHNDSGLTLVGMEHKHRLLNWKRKGEKKGECAHRGDMTQGKKGVYNSRTELKPHQTKKGKKRVRRCDCCRSSKRRRKQQRERKVRGLF